MQKMFLLSIIFTQEAGTEILLTEIIAMLLMAPSKDTDIIKVMFFTRVINLPVKK